MNPRHSTRHLDEESRFDELTPQRISQNWPARPLSRGLRNQGTLRCPTRNTRRSGFDNQASWIASPVRSAIRRATFLGRKNVYDENLASFPSLPST